MKKINEQTVLQLQSGLAGIEASSIRSVTDQFDLDSLRLSQNFSDSLGVKKALLTVPVRKPNRQDFFRVRPEPEYSLETVILELKEERTSYLVAKELWADMSGELVPKILFTTINRQGVLSLWPVRLPAEDGRQDNWSRSAHDAADMAKKSWIRMTANMDLGAYEIHVSNANIPEPSWPEIPFPEILKIAFRDQFINSLDHPVVRRLMGAS